MEKKSKKLTKLYASIPKTPTDIDTTESVERLSTIVDKNEEEQRQPINNIHFTI